MNHADHYVKAARVHPLDVERLTFIQDYLERHGYAPSVREFQRFCSGGRELWSMSSVYNCLNRLKERGLVDWVSESNRTLHVTDYGREVLGG